MKKRLISIIALIVLTCTTLTACKSNATLQEFIDSEEFQASKNSFVESYSSYGIEIDVLAEGDSLIYAMQFPEGTSLSGMEKSIGDALDAQASTFQEIAADIKKVVNASEPSVIIRISESDGTVILEKEYKAE